MTTEGSDRGVRSACPSLWLLLLALILAGTGAPPRPALAAGRSRALSDQGEILVLFGDDRGQRRIATRALDGGADYLGASDVAEILHATSYWRGETRKLLLRIGERRLTLAADNPFVILDQNVHRLPTPPRFGQGQLWIPLTAFDLLTVEGVIPAAWDAERRQLVLGQPPGAEGSAARAGRGEEIAPAADSGENLSPAPPSELRPALVVLDAGHGGEDQGTRSVGGVVEKHVTLELAARVKRHLERDGWFKVVLVRERDERLDVPRRVEIANSTGADLFISLHLDLAPGPASNRSSLAVRPGAGRVIYEDVRPFVAGAISAAEVPQTLSFKRWETAGSDRSVESYQLAQIIANELEARFPGAAAEVHRRPAWALEGANMPAALLELGPPRGTTAEAMATADLLERMGGAVAAGIRRYWLGSEAPRAAPAPMDWRRASPHGVER